jgi:3-oxoacyl-[acyl-carrier protein] reductase
MDTLSAARLAELAGAIPVGRFGTGEEVAALVAYLCSDRAAFITGTTVDINGGLHMR